MNAEYLKAIAELISAVAWPSIALVIVLMNRAAIAKLLDRINKVVLPGGVAIEAELREAVEKEADSVFKADPDAAKRVTPEQLAAAERINRLVAGEDLAAARRQMIQLARDYENTRAALPPGDDRTARMEAIATKMRLLGIACASYLKDFVESASPGERLAGISILEVQPHKDHLIWLASRLGTEAPFVGYHAALALLAAVRVLGRAERQLLKDAIDMAQRALGHDPEQSDRARVLYQAERELQALN
jgi:hypothetical protein